MEEKFSHAEEPEEGKNFPFQTKDVSSNISSSGKADNAVRATGNFTFGRDEKLKSRKLIDQLFSEGKSVSVNGFTLVYLYTPLAVTYPVQAGFSVPKRFFKHAVERNRVKRLLREAWRHQKAAVYEKLKARQTQAAIMWIYRGKQLPDLKTTTQAVEQCIAKWVKR